EHIDGTAEAEACGHGEDERELDDHDRDDGAELAEDEPVRAQRSRGQLPEHPVATVEGGGDGLTGERARGQAQAQRTGNGDVERVRRGVEDVEAGEQGSLGQEDEQTEGEDDRQQQLLAVAEDGDGLELRDRDRKSTRLNSSHVSISYAVFCLIRKE